MLSRIRNANSICLERVVVPYTRLNFQVLHILKDEGFIDSFEKLKVYSSSLQFISISLRFKKGQKQRPYISFLKRVSRPGLRVYVNSDNVPVVWGGIGIAVFLRFYFYVALFSLWIK